MKPILLFAALLPAAFPLHAALNAGQNLLTNGSGTDDTPTGWTVIAGGGDGWSRSSGGGFDSEGGYFITSYGTCSRSQTIDLLAKGATAAELDAAPPLRVSEAISMNFNRSIADSYYIRVELRDAAGGVIARWDAGTSAAMKTATPAWVVESHEFRDYGPGVRSIYFEDGGIDGGYWAGFYGTWHDAATVSFLNNPVTGITLTPSGFPSNVPAGGLAGQLRAVDEDNPVHTFTLEPEITTSTETLLTASSTDWRYFDAGVLPAANWMAADFDDSTWAAGPAPLGYDSGNADTWQVTKVSYGGTATAKPLTTWFRKTFTVADPAAITGLSATLLVDDGCVVYLNGQELFRDGMPEGEITESTAASRGVSGADESDYDAIVIPPDKLALLTAGANVLAVEVHQDRITSSDLGIDLTLTATLGTAVNQYSNELFTLSGSELRLKEGSAGLAPGPYTVRVKAVDAAGNALVRLLTVERTDAVSAAAPSGFTLTPLTVTENASAETLIGSFTPADSDPGDAHAYELVSGTGDSGNAMVSIADNRLFVLQSPDFETTPGLPLRVRVTDSAGLSVTREFTVSVTDDTAEDADSDGLTEAEEDLNNNGVLDAGETDPVLPDTDGDSYSDRDERTAGSDPRDPGSVPAVLELRQIATHPTGDSWLTAASWQGGQVPQAIHLTVTDNLTLRPPPEADPVFPGAGVDLRNGAIFRLKHTGLATVPRIILRNAMVQHGMTGLISLGGPASTLEVPATGTIDTAAQPLAVSASLSRGGILRVIGTTAGQLRLEAPATAFTGELWLENPEVVLTDAAASGARRILLKSGILRTEADQSLPDTVLQRTASGKLALTHTITAGAFIVDGAAVPPGTHTGADLLTLGVSPEAIEDAGGTLVITGNPGSRDTDGDGAGDLLEILAQTNPGSPGDALRLNAPAALSPGRFRLRWTAVPGVTYTVQTAVTPEGSWIDLTAVTPVNTAGTADIVLQDPQAATRFFRLALKQ